MQDDFDLGIVLSVLTGINLVRFDELYDFFCFLFEDENLVPEDMSSLRAAAKKHILRIHPELMNIKYEGANLPEWLSKQKILFGEKLTISIIGENIIKLEKQPTLSLK